AQVRGFRILAGASTKPQRLAAEIGVLRLQLVDLLEASTKPQRLAAEIVRKWRRACHAGVGFNEAAAFSCGDPRAEEGRVRLRTASTKPQRLAAEIMRCGSVGRSRFL